MLFESVPQHIIKSLLELKQYYEERNKLLCADLIKIKQEIDHNNEKITHINYLLPEVNEELKKSIHKLLQIFQGTICHIDFILSKLNDDKEDKYQQQEVIDCLERGIREQIWFKIPDEVDCYTFDIKLIPQNSNGKAKERKYQMVDRYNHMSVLQAITHVIDEKPRDIFTSKVMIQELFGNLDDYTYEESMQIKQLIVGEMSRGAREGKFRKITNQLGKYISFNKH